jgi:1,5-anhydro-D-fructose reductase (1,5-anhydro-D-mannitol-forming)
LKNQDSVRWGLVGLGSVVEDQIAPALLKTAGAELAACAGSTMEKSRAFAERFGAKRAYASYEQLVVDGDIDAVYIATPNGLHHPVALAAARAGKHVLCEKPLALSVAHAREIVDTFAKARLVLRVAFQIRFEEILTHVRDAINSGGLGDLRLITFERTAPFGARANWRQDPAQGGILFDVAIHLLDLAQWLTGLEFREVCAHSNPDRRDGMPDTTIAILGKLGANCHVSIRASNELPFAQNDLVIEGTRGILTTSALRWVDEYVLRIRNESGITEMRLPPSPMYQREFEAFERELKGERSALPTGEQGLRIVELASAVLESIRSRRSIGV